MKFITNIDDLFNTEINLDLTGTTTDEQARDSINFIKKQTEELAKNNPDDKFMQSQASDAANLQF